MIGWHQAYNLNYLVTQLPSLTLPLSLYQIVGNILLQVLRMTHYNYHSITYNYKSIQLDI